MEETGSAAIDRQAVRSILRRAADLDPTDTVPITEVALDDDALVAAAAEAGIPETVVRRAIAVERLGELPPRRGRVLGPPVVAVDEQLHADATEVVKRLDKWLVGGHHMRRERVRGGSGSWSRRRGVVGSTFRALRRATGEGQLGDRARIDVAAVDCGDGSCVVRVTADRRRDRIARGATGAAVASATTAGTVVAALALGPVMLVAAPVGLAVGTGVAMSGRRDARRLATELDRVLDDVEHGARPARLGTDIARRVVHGTPTPTPPA